MATQGITIGSFVETCSLLPGVVMKIDGDDIEVRMLNDNEYNGEDFSCCSIHNCGVRPIKWSLALKIVTIGLPRIGEIYTTEIEKDNEEDFYQRYDKVIDEEYNKLIIDRK